jgi:hypothetical protein
MMILNIEQLESEGERRISAKVKKMKIKFRLCE